VFQSLRKSAILILLCILHHFQSLFKSFPWSPLQISFWNELFFLTVNLLSSELNSYYLLLRQVFVMRQVFRNFPSFFTVAPSFFIAFLLLRQVFHCTKIFHCFLLLRPSFHSGEFSATDLFVAQSFCCYLFLCIVQRLLFLFICVERLLQSIVVRT
jgi:hypothetical protein